MSTIGKTRGSATLAKLAHRLGVKVKDPVSFDWRNGRFYTVEDSANARTRIAIDEAHLTWLLDLAQRDGEGLTPDDEAMLAAFIWAHTTAEPQLNAVREAA